MKQNKLSSRTYTLIKSAVAAAALPVMFIYVMIAKPDYKFMNAAGHIVVPVAQWMGGVITWPVRAVGNVAKNIHELTILRSENKELRIRLDAALANKTECEIALLENKKLARELDLAKQTPTGAIVADVIHDNTAFHHSTFLINRGTRDGIAQNMAVITTDGRLVGIVSDVAAGFARVRALTDSASNIAVRIVGSDVYGFMAGDGTATPEMGFFSDTQFQATTGLRLITSNISGILPAGIVVGDMINETDVRVALPGSVSRVMVLRFDSDNKYK